MLALRTDLSCLIKMLLVIALRKTSINKNKLALRANLSCLIKMLLVICMKKSRLKKTLGRYAPILLAWFRGCL